MVKGEQTEVLMLEQNRKRYLFDSNNLKTEEFVWVEAKRGYSDMIIAWLHRIAGHHPTRTVHMNNYIIYRSKKPPQCRGCLRPPDRATPLASLLPSEQPQGSHLKATAHRYHPHLPNYGGLLGTSLYASGQPFFRTQCIDPSVGVLVPSVLTLCNAI